MILALIYKDLINFRENMNIRKNMLIVFLIYIAILFLRGTGVAGVYLSIALYSLVMSGLSYDDKANAKSYLRGMPISSYELVLSKYLESIFIFLVILLVSFLTYAIRDTKGLLDFSKFMEVLVTNLALFVFYNLYIALAYKFGVKKAPIILIIFCILLSVFIIICINLFGPYFPNIGKSNFIKNPKILFVGGLLFIYILSYFVTLRLVERGDS